MKTNTFTQIGIYLGTGIGQFPTMHCFQRRSGKSYVGSLEGIKEISEEKFNALEKADEEAKEKFFAGSLK